MTVLTVLPEGKDTESGGGEFTGTLPVQPQVLKGLDREDRFLACAPHPPAVLVTFASGEGKPKDLTCAEDVVWPKWAASGEFEVVEIADNNAGVADDSRVKATRLLTTVALPTGQCCEWWLL